jgi:hypothetical protein
MMLVYYQTVWRSGDVPHAETNIPEPTFTKVCCLNALICSSFPLAFSCCFLVT